MGNKSSKGSMDAAEEKALLGRLRAISVREEDDYSETAGGGNEKIGCLGPWRTPEELPLDSVASMSSSILHDPKNRLAASALRSANPRKVLVSQAVQLADRQIFNVKIPFEGSPITNQKGSGRCWLFAATNIFRIAIMRKYNLDEFELSQAYLFYWDKLEKCNWFLENIIDTAGEDLEGRLVQTFLEDPVSDGGQWDMVHNLVDKYGLVPKSVYPDNWSAENSGVLNFIVNNKLREFALRLRRMARTPGQAAADLGARKTKMMHEMQLILTLLLGPPPNPTEEFTWQYSDKDGKAHELTIKPGDFAKDISSAGWRVTAAVVDDMISLVHDPRHEPLSLLTISRLGNVVGGRGITYVNVDMETLKSACVRMLRSGLPVFFGCDVGQFSDSSSGIMDTQLFDYELGLGVSLLGMTKAQRLVAEESRMTHAMMITAVHVDEQTGKPARWRVQNSWGPDAGDKGWFVMSDAWMDEFVYQVVVDPRLCSREVRDVIKKEPIVLPRWDPLGSLA